MTVVVEMGRSHWCNIGRLSRQRWRTADCASEWGLPVVLTRCESELRARTSWNHGKSPGRFLSGINCSCQCRTSLKSPPTSAASMPFTCEGDDCVLLWWVWFVFREREAKTQQSNAQLVGFDSRKVQNTKTYNSFMIKLLIEFNFPCNYCNYRIVYFIVFSPGLE